MRQALNGIVLPHGGFTRRPGRKYVAEAKNTTADTTLIPFVVDATQQYVIEAGEGYFRFFANNGVVGAPYEIATPYVGNTVRDLSWAQRADAMYIVHKNFPPYKLTRTAFAAFTLAEVVFVEGHAPMRASNATTTTVSAVLIAGVSYTLTWSASISITAAADVGRYIKVTDGATTYRYYKITSVTSTSVAIANLVGGVHDATARQDWALATISNAEGPRCVTFHEGRLWYAGALNTPDQVDSSVSDEYDNFDLGNGSDADRSISKRVVSNQVNVVVWMRSQATQLALGSSSGEFRVTGAGGDIMTPTSAYIRNATARGSASIKPVQVNSSVLYVQRAQRTLFEFKYDLTGDTYLSKNFTILAEDIFDDDAYGRGKVTKIVYQEDPNSVIWCVRGDGRVVGVTYEPDQKVVGAHLHDFGGFVQDLATIVNQASRDQLWDVTDYVIGGVTRRYISYTVDPFKPSLDRRATQAQRIRVLDTAFFVDCGLSLDSALTITSITQANPAVVTSTAHGLSNGDRVKLRIPTLAASANPMPDDNMHELDNLSAIVAGATANTFQLTGINSTAYSTYAERGTARKEVSSVSGLTHLEGRTVAVLADGAVHTNQIVTAGAITLDHRASIVHVGLPFDFRGETQRFIGGAKLGTDQGQTTKIQRVAVILHATMGGVLGVGNGLVNATEELQYRDGDTPMDQSPPLYSGDKEVAVEAGWIDNGDATAYFENTQPLPMTVVAIMPRMRTNER